MKVTLLSHTPNPEKTIACAAKLCYANTTIGDLYDGLTDEKAENFVQMLSTIGHESPIEHVSFTFGIEGVSRAFLAQITRHRIASYSVQSQRYVKEDKFAFVIPPEIEADETAKELFLNAMDADIETYRKLTEILSKKHYETFLKEGQAEKEAKQKAEKKAIEDARFVLPNACDTQMIVTMNARSLLNFFQHRCCNRAQWEIKAVADEMLRLVCEVAPTLFSAAGPNCYKKACPEGKMSCGKITEMREFYTTLHENAEKRK
ncbi:FAD-dependent thymidylate synthase [Paludicola sp. MB14-C6]|uniref:FAD-dependent thymidylate synthase n=1 Tax=Paludihabitans sp. MB14-C6 TaxID=3070656 RepID=UPI0027DAB67A|nr:FAD-dependent thymidylate synthase [Paludicola sp. MB14-C6]WMJ23439.1 FAD-dependent thymidylate synthase [Paludicola sp. MB14-C6]